jgi:protein-tyrosine phosphatase
MRAVTMPVPDSAAHAGFDPALRIDWIPASLFADGRPGRLGLTFLPGKHGPSVLYPGRVYNRDADADLATLRDAGVRLLLVLVEDHELVHWSEPDLVERGTRAGVRVIRHPVPDGQAPDLAEMREILGTVHTEREVGDVAVACMGGVGRTGTVAACALVEVGLSADEAIAWVRQIRHPRAVETQVQQRFVEAFEAAR